MKRLSLIVISSAFILGFGTASFAQDSAPVMYIPGMPYPQQTAAPSGGESAAADGEAAAASNASKISKVSKAGDRDRALAEQAAENALAAEAAKKRASERAAYKGVTPPGRLVPENADTFARTQENQVTWIGFMPEAGKHRVFLQTTNPTAYTQVATAADKVELILQGASLAVSNNQRELDMTYFNTPFRTAKATRSGKDVRVVVQLKDAVPYEIKAHDNMLEIFVTPSASNQ